MNVSALRLRDYLQHILQAVLHIREYTAGMELPAFLADRKTQDAVIRNLEVIGEASHSIARKHPEFAAAHPEVPWVVAYEMRNVLAHGYFMVDLSIVWRTVQADLLPLHDAVQAAKTSLPEVQGYEG
jgi:uncharacterized protein with HEPN domain